MSEIMIHVMAGSYENHNAYNCLLGYLSQKAYIGGYGFSVTSSLPIIKQFHLSEETSLSESRQKMWHFCITFSEAWEHNTLLELGIQIASIFKTQYQVFFALDIEKKEKSTPQPWGYSRFLRKPCIPHLHFGVNAFSYHPASPALSPALMSQYLGGIKSLLSQQFPSHTVTLRFKEKEC